MRICKYFVDLKKEEQWLTEMARNGYYIVKGGNGSYTFETYAPGDYIFRIDYRTFTKNSDFRNYCTMFEDSGWLHVAGTKWSGTQYFVKVREDAGEDIFSDNLSSAKRYQRFSFMWLSLALCYTCIFLGLQLNARLPNEIYLTPGLWEMKGWVFVAAFLFETPFAVFRLIPGLIFLFFALFYVYLTVKSYSLYKKGRGKTNE